jgi:5'-3' exonuclease
MILVDLNQVLLSGLMAQISGQKNIKIEEGLIRHLVLNILRMHIKQFRHEYGEVVLCCDNKTYWRKGFFPYYKAGRKKAREKSDLDWHLIFNILGNLKQELKDNFPYKVIDVDGAEADDIIGTLSARHSGTEKVLILSSDGDFMQLQKYNNIKQYNPATKKFVISKNPAAELKEKIIQGDRGDGIPNIFSPDNCFVLEQRQKPITKNRLSELLNENSEKYAEEIKRGFIRNKTLIDLEMTPKEIQIAIIESFENCKPSPKSKLINYFIEKKLKNLMDVIEEF